MRRRLLLSSPSAVGSFLPSPINKENLIMRRAFSILTAAFLCIVATTKLMAAEPSEVLTNASITEMNALGLGDDVIVGKIKASKCDFNTSIAALKKLKEGQVSDAVIQAMLAASKPVVTVAPPPADPNDPK